MMSHKFRIRVGVALVALLAAIGAVLPEDVVEKRDGRKLRGELLSIDDGWVVLQVGTAKVRLQRSEVAMIRFGKENAPPVLKVELRNIRSSDSIDVLLEDEIVIRDARVGGSWVDLTSKLKGGNNRLRFRIRNEHAGWGYHLQMRINGEVQVIACGTPPGFHDPCSCCGKEGYEMGLIDDLPMMWIFVDQDAGSAELVQ